VPRLGSCATPVVPELGGKAWGKPPYSCQGSPRRDPHTPSSEIIAAPPVEIEALLKDAGYGSSNRKLPYMVIPAAADLTSSPLDRAAPLAKSVLLAGNVEFHPRGWVCSTL
jgi:hypothetical protein